MTVTNEQAGNGVHDTLRKQWLDVLHHWQDKHDQYQQQQAQTTDPSQIKALQHRISVCQDIIQTSQGLIHALSQAAPQRDPTNHPGAIQTHTSLATSPSQIHRLQVKPTHASSNNSAVTLDALQQQTSDSPSRTTHQQNTDIEQNYNRPTPLANNAHARNKYKLGLLLPLGLTLGLLGTLLRPRNICTVTPSDTYSAQALAQWVNRALQADPLYEQQFAGIYVAQQGCSITLKGSVADIQDQARAVSIAQYVTVPSENPIEKIKQFLRLGRRQSVQPIQQVNSELKITDLSRP